MGVWEGFFVLPLQSWLRALCMTNISIEVFGNMAPVVVGTHVNAGDFFVVS